MWSWFRFTTGEREVLGVAAPSAQQAPINWVYWSPANPHGLQSRLAGFVNQIYLQAVSADAVQSALRQVTETLQRRHRIKPGEIADDFAVRNLSQIAETAQSSSRIMALLAAVASISLLVGGIGIMNILLVSVTERTSEIGLRMAIGALRLHVLLQFLAEAVLISVNGGIAGHRHRCCSVPGRFVPRRLASTGLGRRHCRRFPVLSRRGNLLRLLSRTQSSASRPDQGAAVRVSAPGRNRMNSADRLGLIACTRSTFIVGTRHSGSQPANAVGLGIRRV